MPTTEYSELIEISNVDAPRARYVKIYTENVNADRWGKDRPSPMAYAAENGETFCSLDTTVKSAWKDMGKAFAPTWDMVMGHKRGEITWAEYTERYVALMRQRYAENKELFLKALSYENLVLRCYCSDTSKSSRKCHRYILADILMKIAKHHNITCRYMGEITKNGYKT